MMHVAQWPHVSLSLQNRVAMSRNPSALMRFAYTIESRFIAVQYNKRLHPAQQIWVQNFGQTSSSRKTSIPRPCGRAMDVFRELCGGKWPQHIVSALYHKRHNAWIIDYTKSFISRNLVIHTCHNFNSHNHINVLLFIRYMYIFDWFSGNIMIACNVWLFRHERKFTMPSMVWFAGLLNRHVEAEIQQF